jgi:hypothetical protein
MESMSAWSELTAYELRNLAPARRWPELDEVVFETGFLRTALHDIGVLDLTRLRAELVDNPEASAERHARYAGLGDLVVDEASF